MLQKKKLFNPDGDDSILHRRIIKGNPTNLFNPNGAKYKWANNLFSVMTGNFWVPEKVDLSTDASGYHLLTKDQQEGIENFLSFLNAIDSLQINNLPHIREYITAPEVSALISLQEFQEVIHAKSYDYIIQSILPADRREKTHELWRDNPAMRERNQYIADVYEAFVSNPNEENFAKSIVANYILESIYFYNGFMFFYSFGAQNLLLDTIKEIVYINRDELTHVSMFQHIIHEINNEFPGFITEEMVHYLFRKGVEAEIQWTNDILKDGLNGITKETTEQYTKHLANRRIQELGYAPIFEETINPYVHLERYANLDGDGVKTNFFESTVTEYNLSHALDGWDEI